VKQTHNKGNEFMNYSITRWGKPLSPSSYVIDEVNKTFSTNCYDLILDFYGFDNWTFKTGSGCTFKTGATCTFETGFHCTFFTGAWCTFDTGEGCTFKTGATCTFNIGATCTILLHNLKSCTFLNVNVDGDSIILDTRDKQHYLLNGELLQLIKVMNL